MIENILCLQVFSLNVFMFDFYWLKLRIFRALKRVKPFNPYEWLASNLSLQYHHWITHWCHENKRNDQQLKKLLSVWQILLVSTLVNVQKKIWRIWILMFGCKGLKNPDIVGHDVSWPMKTWPFICVLLLSSRVIRKKYKKTKKKKLHQCLLRTTDKWSTKIIILIEVKSYVLVWYHNLSKYYCSWNSLLTS